MQVVEHDQEGPPALGALEQVEHALEQELAPLLRRHVLGRQPAQLWPQARDQVQQHGAAVGDGVVQRPRRLRDRAREHLAERLIRSPRLLAAAAVEHHPSLSPGVGGHLGGEARGSDARRAGDQDHAARAGRGAVEHEANVHLLLVAADEGVDRVVYDRDGGGLDAGARLVQAPPVGEALQLVGAAVGELDLGDRADQLPDDLGDEDLAAPRLARDRQFRAIAFPAIATGIYGYPGDAAAHIAVATVRPYLTGKDRPERVIFVCFDDATLAAPSPSRLFA